MEPLFPKSCNRIREVKASIDQPLNTIKTFNIIRNSRMQRNLNPECCSIFFLPQAF